MEDLTGVMTHAFLRVGPGTTVVQALDRLRETHAQFVLLDNAYGTVELLADADVLRRAPPGERLSMLREKFPRPLVVPVDVPFERVLGVLSQELVEHLNVPGVIVALGDEPQGVIPRQAVIHATAQRTRATSQSLPGTPVPLPPVYECKTDGYRRVYVPAPPVAPSCPQGHTMVRV